MAGAEIPAAFGATVDARLQAIIALPLFLQFKSGRSRLSRGQSMALLKMQENLVQAKLSIPLPESGLPAMATDRLIALHLMTIPQSAIFKKRAKADSGK
jgi:hypothetical protein